jgi:poly-gamma-glutamate capsule biosynthesis protein CapA/YwtB (metallophosphatase superfamily)
MLDAMAVRAEGAPDRARRQSRGASSDMDRRHFLATTGRAFLAGLACARETGTRAARAEPHVVTLFLCGDVMTGRGIDQILPHAGDPELFEPWIRSARGYVELAERATGPIPRPVDFPYVWGEALAELARADVRIVNLETAVTRSDQAWPAKGIHYRMHPGNVPCLTAARIDCCVLANNHVLDWGSPGLMETLETLHAAGIRTAGAGRDAAQAEAAAALPTGMGRVLVFASATPNSGVPRDWAAGPGRAGVAVLTDLSATMADAIARRVQAAKRPGDVGVVSIHWGPNWGFAVSSAQRAFAERLAGAGVDVVHGHSSHHVKAIQVHRGKLILYGCGDLLTDYEGIRGHEEFRGELGLLYFPTFDAATAQLVQLAMVPTRMRHFRVERAPTDGVDWLVHVLNREGRPFGSSVERQQDGTLLLRW